MDLYGEIILDHFKNPRNAGTIDDADIIGEDLNPLCGDKVKAFLKLDENGLIQRFAFCADGCAISVAATSIIGEGLAGLSLQELESLENEKIYEMIGVPISTGRVKCALLGISCIRKAIKLYKAENAEKGEKNKG